MQTRMIILQSSEISCKMGAKCAARARELGNDVQIFNGIHGRDAHKILAQQRLVQYKPKMKGGRLGVLGCFLSHYFLWRMVVATKQPLMILEHDAWMLRPLPDNVLELFPDVLKLDSLNPYLSTYNKELEAQSDDLQIWSLHDRKEHGKHEHSRGLYSMGGYGYIIKPHAAEEIIDQCFRFGFRPADHMLHTTDKIDIHHIAPSIVRIHEEYTKHSMKTMSLTRNLEANSS